MGKKKEIDWNKIPKWTKIVARSPYEKEMKNAYFLETSESGRIFVARCDEFTYKDGFDGEIAFVFDIHPSVEIKEEWYK